mmetsp:Transcript_4922/g.14726  ORF Transcript_4922/g.14726 Transcript_4922/m.14726 type:complete len:294 (-) Transcript_4922:1823-2704(-)
MVCGLIEKQDVGLSPRQLGKGQPRFLSTTERLYRLQRQVSRKSKPAEVLPGLLHRYILVQPPHVGHRIALHVKHVQVMLRELGKPELAVPVDAPLRRHDLAVQELQERGLTRTVGPDHRDPRVHIQTEVQVPVQRRLVQLVSKLDVDDRDARRRKGLGARELELEIRVVVIDVDGLVLELLEHLHPRLRLPRHLLVPLAEPRDELLEMGRPPVLNLLHGLLVRPVLGSHLQKRVVASAIVPKPLPVQEYRRRRALVQETSVVGDDHDGLVPLLQESFEPRQGVDVQVVRGLVK